MLNNIKFDLLIFRSARNGPPIGLLVKVNNIIHDEETAKSSDWPFLINKRFRFAAEYM